MQSHTLLESHPSSTPIDLHAPLTPSRMGPVPDDFRRPLPVLSSSNGNTTLKYKKAAILHHNRISQELDAKYKYEGENKTGSRDDDENNAAFADKPSVYPKHFASMQGPYGIVNNNLFKKEEFANFKKNEDELKSRSRFSSDVFNNNTSDRVNTSQVNYSGQFQANFIGHVNNHNYLNRPNVTSERYYNGTNGHGDREVGNPTSRNSPQTSRNSPQRPVSSASPQQEQNTSSQEDPAKKFKVPSSKVPKESLLKYRILHKNNQRNVTQISNESTAVQDSPNQTRNGSPCDTRISQYSSLEEVNGHSIHFKRPNSDPKLDLESNGYSVNFKRPDSDPKPDQETGYSVHFKRPDSEKPDPEPSGPCQQLVTNGTGHQQQVVSDIQPNHFCKGVLIRLENGAIKQLEDLKTEDFVSSAEKSTQHRLEPSTVMKIEERAEGSSIVLTLCYGEKRHQVRFHPFILFISLVF